MDRPVGGAAAIAITFVFRLFASNVRTNLPLLKTTWEPIHGQRAAGTTDFDPPARGAASCVVDVDPVTATAIRERRHDLV
jgi:hypothetical protein